MRIAIIHYRYGTGGGMDAYFSDLAEGFSADGDVVDLYVYEHDKKKPLPNNVNVIQAMHRRKHGVIEKIAFHRDIVRNVELNNYDIVISVMRTARQDINVNGGTHIGFATNVNGRIRSKDLVMLFLERRALRKSRLVVTHSRMIRDEIISYYKIPEDKVALLYPPANEKRFNLELRSKRDRFIDKLAIDSNKFSVFFPSTNHKIKGLRPLIEAFRTLPDDRFELLVAGAALPHDGIPSNVRYLGYLSDIEEGYTGADITILPSLYDGFGLVVIESLACGTPVIVSRKSGASELLDESHGIVIDDVTPDAIRQAIIKASSTKFAIDPDFLKRRSLTLGQHIEQFKAIWREKGRRGR